MDLFQAWGTRHAGLFTFAQSAKHVGLYQKYGFWPRFLTAVMTSPVRPGSGPDAVRLSALDDAGGVRGVAICHVGAGTEAGPGACYVTFGAVRPGQGAERAFDALATERGASALVAGANAGRDRAWRAPAGQGFRRQFQGVAMHRPNEPGYSTSDSFVIDDWR